MSAGEPYTLKLYEAQGMLQVVYTLKLNPLEKKYGVCYLSQTLLYERLMDQLNCCMYVPVVFESLVTTLWDASPVPVGPLLVHKEERPDTFAGNSVHHHTHYQ